MSFSFPLHRTRAAKAFTLLEILTVLAIIGILTAIVLSAYFSTRGKSHEVVCMENLRQIGAGIKIYENDYDDLPHKFKTLYPAYVSDAQIFRCPIWDAVASTKSQKEQDEIKAIFSLYSYQPEETRFWNEKVPHEDEPPASHTTWEQAYALRGERLVLVRCQFHDPTLFGPREKMGIGPDGKLQMTWMVLRLDGSVSKTTQRPKGRGGDWYNLYIPTPSLY